MQRLVAADAHAANRDFSRRLHSGFSRTIEAHHSVCGTGKFCKGSKGRALGEFQQSDSVATEMP